MQERELPPGASSLSESMRDIGYSLETAVADIIDNSLTAKAERIEIFCDLNGVSPILAIIDDGKGMVEDILVDAMRHGSQNPRKKRKANDLGRFGLGLKTASFSQSRHLTVLSRSGGELSGAIWDLDVLSDKDKWIINILEKDDFSKVPLFDQLTGDGTLVVWQNLDRLSEKRQDASRDEIIYEKLELLNRHLSLVFHRYIVGEVPGRKKVAISLNGHLINAFDPFCLSSGTQIMPKETVRLGGQEINIQPYILPHHSKLTQKQFDFYADRSDFLSNQGVYVYRNCRLMAWGDWFRLIPKGEATKLARIQIDFPTSMDELWTIDIKKSRASPPYEVRERLKQIIEKIANQSVRVHVGRGKKRFDKSLTPFWARYDDRSNIRYEPDIDHPLIQAFRENLGKKERKQFEEILFAVGSSVPVDAIYADYAKSPRNFDNPVQFQNEDIITHLQTIKETLETAQSVSVETFKQVVISTKAFEGCANLVDTFVKENFKNG